MIVVVFEFEPDPERGQRYFELAAALRPVVESIDGFISVERFRSLTDPNRYVSVSFWRDREAVERWKAHPAHRRAQREGIEKRLFRDFRITVAEITSQRELARVLEERGLAAPGEGAR